MNANVNKNDPLDMLVTLGLATYLSEFPDLQVKRMTKRYMAQIPSKDKPFIRMLRTIHKHENPALLVRISYNKFRTQIYD